MMACQWLVQVVVDDFVSFRYTLCYGTYEMDQEEKTENCIPTPDETATDTCDEVRSMLFWSECCLIPNYF
jgi:hypothetical protein